MERLGSEATAEAQGSESKLSADMLKALLLPPGIGMVDAAGGVVLLGEWGIDTKPMVGADL